MKKYILMLSLVVTLCVAASAQITNPATATTTVKAVKAESLSVAASSVPNFAVNAGGTASAADQDLTITTTGNFVPARTSVAVCASMTSTGMAGTGGNTDVIPVTSVQASTSTTFAGINSGTGCTVSTATLVSTNALSAANRKAFSKTDVLHLRLTSLDPALQADTYTGTITVYAYVTP